MFGHRFNNGSQPLRDSLGKLTKLESLTFDSGFNNGGQPFANSLNLKELKEIVFVDDPRSPNLPKIATRIKYDQDIRSFEMIKKLFCLSKKK